MNVEMSGTFKNGFPKPDYKNKETGEIIQGDYVVQVEQRKELSNGSIQIESYDIPVERVLEKQYQDKKLGDIVKVPCNVYGENFAQIKVGKAKK